MITMKIIDKLSNEEIPGTMINMCCTNPTIISDQWYTELHMSNHEATRIIPIEHAIDSKYQVFALYYDGRPEGSVWYPVTVTRTEKIYCHTCGARIDEEKYDHIDGGICVMCGSQIKRSE